MRQEWLAEVQGRLLPALLSDGRLKEGKKLIARFEQEVETWKKTDKFRPVIEIGNEVAAAECFLNSLGKSEQLTYEPKMTGTQKRIDFQKIDAAGCREWFEVKTVAPQWADDEAGWQRFMRIAQDFPENARLVVEKEWAGAAIAGQAIKARWSFIQRTVEVEERCTVIPETEKGPVWLVFCSTGVAWSPDELEDFADFYRTGKHREDDWMRNAADRYMREEGIRFGCLLAGFCYLGRKHDEVSAHDFRKQVSGPNFGA